MPVWQACEILGEPVVRRMVSSLLHMRQNSAANKALLNETRPHHQWSIEHDLEVLTLSLFYRHEPGSSVPGDVAHAWKRWLSARNLALDKNTLIQFVVPHTVQPHSGPNGHMGLFDCWVYALQGHSVTSSTYYGGGGSNTLVWLPDVIIMLAASQNYCQWADGGPNRLKGPGNPSDTKISVATPVAKRSPRNNNDLYDEDAEPDELSSDDEEEDDDDDEDDLPPQPSQPPPTAPDIVDKYRRSPTLSPVSRKSSIAEAMKARHQLDDDDEEEDDDDAEGDSSDDNNDEQEDNPSPSEPDSPAPRSGSPLTLTQSPSAISEASSRKNLQFDSEDAVRAMAMVAFRIYDSYQKKGVVARDTVHRFMTDVHGEDSFKEAPTKTLLNQVFGTTESTSNANRHTNDVAAAAAAASDLQASVTEVKFIARLVETFDFERRSHLLLDWLAKLIGGMVPPAEVAPSVNAYLDTMERRPKPLCEIYQISESRLFEVKRRFHSLVQSGPTIIQGDPMGGGVAETDGSAQAQSSSSSSQANQQPKHTISQSAFLEAVCQPNEEMGHGGYLPTYLAELVFTAGSRNLGNNGAFAVPSNGASSGSGGNDGNSNGPDVFWGLANLIQFGCMAVRKSILHPDEAEDVPVLKFLFSVFSMGVEGTGGFFDSQQEPKTLSRPQVERMLLLMIAHTEFRIGAESSPIGGKNSSLTDLSVSRSGSSNDTMGSENPTVDLEASYLLGLLPPDMERPESGKLSVVPLQLLVDYAFEATAGSSMTFEEFCAWNASAPDGGPASRLLPIINDLRLIASVLFGIPPTKASLEISLIAEIERRHKARYPQTSVSRRGPRGTIWYIIDAEWLRSWAQRVKDVAGTDEDAVDGRLQIKGGIRGLGRIENAGLLFNATLALRQDIQWKHDYEILPPLAWHGLQAWYDGGPPIYRSVVRYVDSGGKAKAQNSNKARMPTENEIELYPYFVTVYLCDAQSGGEARPFQQNYQLSRVSPVGAMLAQLCKELDVEPRNARLWALGSAGTSSLGAFDRSSFTGEDVVNDWILSGDRNIVEQRKAKLDPGHIKRDIHLLLELRDPDTLNWPRGDDGKGWMHRDQGANKIAQTENLGDGIVGLYNMGNTCFLNSSIQCISHTPIFREYFTSKAYLNDVNKTNPMGYEGQLAQVSAVLINSLWKPFPQSNAMPAGKKQVTAPGSYVMVNAQSLTPKTFKESLGKFNEVFSGNEQHDAQELLTFLLAGLSEDLNRIVDKPYIEAPDSDGRPDKELADIWWANHLKRELSIVVALFNGQYKNLLTCQTCGYESARFEPFSTLTLPLPEDDSLTASIILYPFSDRQEPTRYCVRVSSTGTLGNVLLELARLLLEDEESDVGAENGAESAITSTQMPQKGGKVVQPNEGPKDRIEGPDPRVERKARDLSIVDMRDGYIFRIAPLSWQLHDLQNKDTGDLPTMHAYELGDGTEPANTDGESKDENGEEVTKSGYLAISQRRSDLVSRDYLHPLSHKLFGTPMLLRIPDMENCPGSKLYDMVASRLRPLVPKAALRFLAREASSIDRNTRPQTADELRQFDSNDLSERGASNGMVSTLTDSENVSAGPVPRYGFRLRVTSRDGRRCLICPWYKCCVGCMISDDETLANVMDGDSLVVDWHFAVDVATLGFGLRSGLLDPIAARPNPAGLRAARPTGAVVKAHRSCGIGGKGSQAGAITLEECLDAFAKEERLEAYCSHPKCKDFRVQTTRMTLWRLPPVLVIHLKRFQFTQTMRRKLRDLVVFPLEGLDLSRIMAQGGAKSEGINSVPGRGTGEEDSTANTEGTAEETVEGGTTEQNPSQLYDLYGVIHHQGALSGGHYVASLKSEIDGQWRLFNDAQIYEIHARDVIDASAYILFYMRRDVAVNAHLSDFWDLKQVATLNEEEVDNLVKGKAERCVIQ